jgi:hypothetical protein
MRCGGSAGLGAKAEGSLAPHSPPMGELLGFTLHANHLISLLPHRLVAIEHKFFCTHNAFRTRLVYLVADTCSLNCRR